MASTLSPVVVEPLGPAVGASIGGVDLHQPLDAATKRALRDAFVRYSVLCFPGQTITATDQVRFADMFGQADETYRSRVGPGGTAARSRGVMLISNIRKDGRPVGALPDGEMQFHTDGAHREIPYRATTLYAIEIPSRGGETLFANLAASTGRPLADIEADFTEDSPFGTLGEPEDVARMIVLLASDAAKNITGSSITTDGGRSRALA